MKVCLILEGCYPYVRGGVSAWAHQYITASPDTEFILWTVHAAAKDTQERLYDLPGNVSAHHQVYLTPPAGQKARRIRPRVAQQLTDAVRAILAHRAEGWMALARGLRENAVSGMSLVHSPAFLSLARELSDRTEGLGLADAYYSLCSMMLPICQVLCAPIPEAEVYHAAVAGYGGLLGAAAACFTGRPLLLTEHGIYPREREEELLAATWTIEAMQGMWTSLFFDMSRCAYDSAALVTSLFPGAALRQQAIGCDPSKCRVIPNGIVADRFAAIPLPKGDRELHIGAFVRFAAIKDLKTMIRAFHILRRRVPSAVLHLMGGVDDEDYYASCLALIRRLGLEDSIRVEGHVDAVVYMAQMHFTVLSSISEGQPLTILESMAAGRPCIATRVGSCEGLLDARDPAKAAGICCTPMSPAELADAMETLCRDAALRARMGENGRRKVRSQYRLERMLDAYHDLYKEVNDHGRNRI